MVKTSGILSEGLVTWFESQGHCPKVQLHGLSMPFT
jgi:hypothetical protein